MACWLYEGMILFGVVFVAAYFFGTMTQTKHGLSNRHGLQAFVFMALGIYFSWFWSKGQTIAQKTWHIRVTGAHGQAITQLRALLRYLLSWLWLLPPLFVASMATFSGPEVLVLSLGWVAVWAVLSRFAPGQQFWHDVLAGTRLVDARKPDPAVAAPATNTEPPTGTER